MGSTDWFAKKLGGGAPPAQPSTPGVAAPPHAPVQQQQQQQQQQPAPQEDTGGFYDVLQGRSTKTNGGQAARTELENCPGCGSRNYFSRANAPGVAGRPRQHCYDCGWPVVQFGSEQGQGGSMQAMGQA